LTGPLNIAIWIATALTIALALWATLRRKNWIVMLCMVVLVGISLYFVIPPSTKTHLGLDLQGGLEIVYQAKTADGKVPSSTQLDQTISILDRRVNGLGVTESAIQKQGTDQVSVSLPGVKDPQQALKIISSSSSRTTRSRARSARWRARMPRSRNSRVRASPRPRSSNCPRTARLPITRSSRARPTPSVASPNNGTSTSFRRR
jgi:preprotein translocase subunit SecD